MGGVTSLENWNGCAEYVERGCRIMGVPIFCDTGTNSRSIHHTGIHNANKFQLKYTL